jgi:hypothetical protein
VASNPSNFKSTKRSPKFTNPSIHLETPVSVSPTALDGGFTSGFTSPQALGLAFLEPCRIPRRVPEALAPMVGVRAAPSADARFASRRRPARSRSFLRLLLTHQGIFQDADLRITPLAVHRNMEAWFPHGSLISLAIMPCTLACMGPRANNPAIAVLSRLSTGTAATCY